MSLLFDLVAQFIQPSMNPCLSNVLSVMSILLGETTGSKLSLIPKIMNVFSPEIFFSLERSNEILILNEIMPFHRIFLKEMCRILQDPSEMQYYDLSTFNILAYVHWEPLFDAFSYAESDMVADIGQKVRLRISQLAFAFLGITNSLTANGDGTKLVEAFLSAMNQDSVPAKIGYLKFIMAAASVSPEFVFPHLFEVSDSGENFFTAAAELATSSDQAILPVLQFFCLSASAVQAHLDQMQILANIIADYGLLSLDPTTIDPNGGFDEMLEELTKFLENSQM